MYNATLDCRQTATKVSCLLPFYDQKNWQRLTFAQAMEEPIFADCHDGEGNGIAFVWIYRPYYLTAFWFMYETPAGEFQISCSHWSTKSFILCCRYLVHFFKGDMIADAKFVLKNWN